VGLLGSCSRWQFARLGLCSHDSGLVAVLMEPNTVARLKLMIVASELLLLTMSVHRPATAQASVGTVDHVRILVRDIKQTRITYLNRLGFASTRTEPFVYPEGSAHDGAPLSDTQYIEWLGVVDRDKMLQSRPWMVQFLDKYEGAHSVGMKVASADELAARLRARGIEAPVFTVVRKEGDKPVVLVTPKLPHIPEGAVFFVQYPPRKSPPSTVPQPNTAKAIRAIWIVVRDVKGATTDIQALGFKHLRSMKSNTLGAEGEEFGSERGNIVLLRPKASGAAAEFSRQRGEGVMGISLLVDNADRAREIVEKGTGRTLRMYKGWYGTSFLIPAETASGAWIEMVQRR
jgi:hypothetical protein